MSILNPPQLDLPFFLVNPEHPAVDTLVDYLRAHPDWHFASEILAAWRVDDTEHNRRVVRALAEAARPEIISGQRGYKWIGHATAEEIDHAANWLESQAKKMAQAAQSIRKRAHQQFG